MMVSKHKIKFFLALILIQVYTIFILLRDLVNIRPQLESLEYTGTATIGNQTTKDHIEGFNSVKHDKIIQVR